MSEQRETPSNHLEDLASAASMLSERVALLAETVRQRDYKILLERLLATVQIILQRVETVPQPERLGSVPKDLNPKLTELSVQMRAILQEVQRCRAEALQRHDEQVHEQKRQRAERDGWTITMILAFIARALASQGIKSLI
jgi:hypothetical protein